MLLGSSHQQLGIPARLRPEPVQGRMLAKDAFRMGNYSLLGYLGGNLGLEFLYSGPHSLISRMHLNVSTEAGCRFTALGD